MKWDKLFEEFFPKKTAAGRETCSVTRPESLVATVVNNNVTQLQRTETTHKLVLEFDKGDRAHVVDMLRRAIDKIEALK